MPTQTDSTGRRRGRWSRVGGWMIAGLLATTVPSSAAAQGEAAAEPVVVAADDDAAAAAARLAAEIAALEAELARLKERAAAIGAALGTPAAAPSPSAAVEATTAAAGLDPEELARRLDALAADVERIDLGETAAVAEGGQFGLGPAASKVYRAARGVSIGGYGEMVYQGFAGERDDGRPSGRTDELDFLRGIVYLGYKFDDSWVLNTELEWEHAASDKSGEISVEFAYLDYLARPELNVRAGMVLLPMGLVNELHEPTVLITARRPGVESAIIPSTWRENGLGLFGDVGPVSYRTYVVNGLDARGFSARGLRSGRQKGSRAKAEDLAWVGRLDFVAVPGLLAGASLYVGDSAQGLAANGAAPDASTRILEGHLAWRWQGLELRGLWAEARVSDAAELNRALGLSGTAGVGERLSGGYVQVAYDLFQRWPLRGQHLRPYLRYEAYDTQERVPAGFGRNPANAIETLTLGVAWQPLEQIVFKLDWEDHDNDAGTGVDQLNLALGYVF